MKSEHARLRRYNCWDGQLLCWALLTATLGGCNEGEPDACAIDEDVVQAADSPSRLGFSASELLASAIPAEGPIQWMTPQNGFGYEPASGSATLEMSTQGTPTDITFVNMTVRAPERIVGTNRCRPHLEFNAELAVRTDDAALEEVMPARVTAYAIDDVELTARLSGASIQGDFTVGELPDGSERVQLGLSYRLEEGSGSGALVLEAAMVEPGATETAGGVLSTVASWQWD